ncbi:MAG: tetratricopeptide repeat protein, partial [Pseudomonadota bacterium]
ARLESAQGSIEVQQAGTTQWARARQGDVLCEGDTVTLGEGSRAALRLPNETVLRLGELSSLRLTAIKRDDESLLDMLKGAVHVFSRVPRSLKVQTPFVNAAIEGTEFTVHVDSNTARITVFEGLVAASNNAGAAQAGPGEAVEARRGEAPQLVTVVKPLDAVQWALYFPPVMDRAELERRAAGLPDGDPQRTINNYLYSASHHLNVGKVTEAEAELMRVTQLAPHNADALALRAVIAVARNENEEALMLAEQAVQRAPESSAARIAQSYAYQARFDLPAATDAARQATELSPDNALAQARLAELLLSQGEFDAAVAVAKKAVEQDPELGRAQTILGFSYLTRVDTGEASSAFEQAIELDPADPLPRLGLGLTRIRRGALEEGRAHIEVAASLDPNNALVRSYLGKAYYEEERDPLAATQYDLAKGLDPNDPTPWLYDAILKQTDNRPVEALEDINRSIELNDNRAVYRSRLQLDRDEAARSISRARIYQDMGFDGLSLLEGSNAVNNDPTNHSSHRFLSDSYAHLPRHETARVSELLQSQLLQPVNLTPLQPQLTDINLGILTAGGPTGASFNELGPMFIRDGFALQADAVYATNDTFGGDLILAGVKGRTAFSLGHFHFETDGFRENNDQDIDSSNIFVQHDISPNLSVQVAGSRTRKDRGDLPLRFDPGNFSSTLRLTDDRDYVRGGIRYSHSPNNTLIGSVVYASTEFTQ